MTNEENQNRGKNSHGQETLDWEVDGDVVVTDLHKPVTIDDWGSLCQVSEVSMTSFRSVGVTRSNRSAFSLLEILVVVVIIGILLAISIPVVRDMRSLSRRSNCDQNLIRLALAIQAYAVDHIHLPSGTLSMSALIWEGELGLEGTLGPSVADTGNLGFAIASLPDGYHHNWISALLPYCDRQGMFQAINFEVGVYAPANAVMRESDVPFLRCPASATDQVPYTSSYAGMHDSGTGPITAHNDGLLMLNRWIVPEGVPDGMAYTILLGEKLSPPEFDLGWMSGTRSSLRGAGIAINADVEIEAYHDPAFVGGLASLHGGGASVAMGGGAVNFLSETVDIQVYRRLVSRNEKKQEQDEKQKPDKDATTDHAANSPVAFRFRN